MQKKLHFLIVDDDNATVEVYKRLLEQAGHQASSIQAGSDALEQVLALQPDCILCDLLMPSLDALQFYQAIRQASLAKQPTFIIITAKLFEFDRRHALKLGVDGYLTKPIDAQTFVQDLLEIIAGTMVVEFWGVRGTLPVPGIATTRYGGNTNCVTLYIAKKHFFIFDAGTGIKELSNALLRRNKFPLSAKIFISHPHYDHINGLPFFAPLYMQGNEFEILGASHGAIGIEKLIGDQMDSVYFPITTKEFAANLLFRNLADESFMIDDVRIQTIALNHPGRCLGYRIDYKNKSFCYVTDNELYLENSAYYNQFEVDRLTQFIRQTDILIIDATYTDEEYAKKTGWGHSSLSRVIDIADKAKVQLLCLYHHDPDQFDKEIDEKLQTAKALLKARDSHTQCIAPHEGEKLSI